MNYYQQRARWFGYREGEQINSLLDLAVKDEDTLSSPIIAMVDSISSLHTLSYESTFASVWGEEPLYGYISSITTTSTLTVIHDTNALWPALENTVIGNSMFPTVTLATYYSVFNTLATCYAVKDVDPTNLYSLLEIGDIYSINRWDTLVADIQELRYL